MIFQLFKEAWAIEALYEEDKSRLLKRYQKDPWNPQIIREMLQLLQRKGKDLGLKREDEEFREKKLRELGELGEKYRNYFPDFKHPLANRLRGLGWKWEHNLKYLLPYKGEEEYLTRLLPVVEEVAELDANVVRQMEADIRENEQENLKDPEVRQWRKEHPNFKENIKALVEELNSLYKKGEERIGPNIRTSEPFYPRGERPSSVFDGKSQLKLDLYNSFNSARILQQTFYELGRLEVKGIDERPVWTYRMYEKIQENLPDLHEQMNEAYSRIKEQANAKPNQ